MISLLSKAAKGGIKLFKKYDGKFEEFLDEAQGIDNRVIGETPSGKPKYVTSGATAINRGAVVGTDRTKAFGNTKAVKGGVYTLGGLGLVQTISSLLADDEGEEEEFTFEFKGRAPSSFTKGKNLYSIKQLPEEGASVIEGNDFTMYSNSQLKREAINAKGKTFKFSGNGKRYNASKVLNTFESIEGQEFEYFNEEREGYSEGSEAKEPTKNTFWRRAKKVEPIDRDSEEWKNMSPEAKMTQAVEELAGRDPGFVMKRTVPRYEKEELEWVIGQLRKNDALTKLFNNTTQRESYSVGSKIVHLAGRLAEKATSRGKDTFLRREFLREMSEDPEFDQAINDLPEEDYNKLMDEIGFDYDMGTGALSSNLGRAQNLDPEMAAKNYMDFGSFENIKEYLTTRNPSEIRIFIKTLEDNAATETDERIITAAERILTDMTELRVKAYNGAEGETRSQKLIGELTKEDLDMAFPGKLTPEEEKVFGVVPTVRQVLEHRAKEKVAEQRRQQESVRKYNAERGNSLAEGGMPVDTYPNIPPEEMDEAMASQLPDQEMEDSYIDFIMDNSLTDEDKEYLAVKLDEDPRLSEILDNIVLTAGEFSGAGEVDGPGTGVSDSIPARLSDGEFVITKKATDQIGADNLQTMMDDAERAYDGGYQMKAVGGYMFDDQEQSEVASPSIIDEEIKKAMIRSNKIPSLQ